MIDVEMENAALGRAVARSLQDQEKAARLWHAILHDKRSGGPFAAMIAGFRDRATDALCELTICEPDAAKVRQLQNEIQRFLEAMMLVKEFEEGAKAYDANALPNSDDDDDYVPQIDP